MTILLPARMIKIHEYFIDYELYKECPSFPEGIPSEEGGNGG